MGEIMNNTFGTLSSAPDNAIIIKIYDYLLPVLLGLKAKKEENENAITNRLCKDLNAKKPSEFPFYFHHQNLEDDKENTSTDFAVFGTYAYALERGAEDDLSLIKFEAKRLNSMLPKRRKKEYAHGEYKGGRCLKNSGGIERFKNGRHGKDVSNAGIIGYIQTDSVSYWFKEVNNWVKGQIRKASDSKLVWQKSDLLVKEQQNGTLSVYSSVSPRIYGDNISLRHFWIDFSS